jgi:hypothetical protein
MGRASYYPPTVVFPEECSKFEVVDKKVPVYFVPRAKHSGKVHLRILSCIVFFG